MENIIISNPKKLEKLKKEFEQGGLEAVHVVTDFDNTLVKAYVNGIKAPSLIALLRDGNYLTADYAEKAHALFKFYAPIEADSTKTSEEKKAAMREWWMRHFELLIKSGLNVSDIERVISSDQTEFREGAPEFFEILEANGIPLIIISSSGLGVDGISLFLRRAGQMRDNIYIVSNQFVWDDGGNAISVKEPIIHSMNKDETTIDEFPFYSRIKSRRNVILLGDSLGDPKMVEGFSYKALIKFGFLNENFDELFRKYQDLYNYVIPGDGSLKPIIDFINIIK